MEKRAGLVRWLAAAATAVLVLASLTPLSAAAQATGKWVTIVVPAEPPSLDGCNATRSFEGRVIKQNVVETLIARDSKDGRLKPQLITAWEQVNPTTWRFTLREGVVFHDGAPFNAETATKAILRSIGPDMQKAGLHCEARDRYFSDLKVEVSPTGPYAIQIVTDRPEPILPTRLSSVAVASPNTPSDKYALHPIGSGPYAFDTWTAGQEITLKRFAGYWGAKPQADGVRYVWRAESAVRAAMARIGEADIALNIAPDEANDPATDYSYLNSETSYLRIDTFKPPLNDKRVRLALNYGMDRDGMRQSILTKDLQHATQLVMPSIAGHNHALDKQVLPYDPAKAKQLLAEARADGVPVDTEILLMGRPASYFNAGEVMEAFLGMYKAIGLKMKLINLEPGQYNEVNNKPFAEDRPPALLQSTHDNNTGDPIFSLTKVSCAGSSSMLCDRTLDDMVAKVATMTGDERVKGWEGVFRYLYEDAVPVVWMYHMVGYARVNPRIDFKPDVTTNNEVRIQEIHFTKK
jgi:peptide/nickel transport system substrate-binding protein